MKNESEIQVVFGKTGEKSTAPLPKLIETTTGFLDHLSSNQLLGNTFCTLIGSGSGQEKLEQLLSTCGYPGDPLGFFQELLGQLGSADGTSEIMIHNIALPHHFLMAILEVILPGSGFSTIKTVEDLERAANMSVPEKDRENLQQVMDTYPVRLSRHIIRQMRVSGNVAYQYLPFIEELDRVGHTNTWIGQFHQGLLEQMYQNRVIFLLHMGCPVYCRFCFRKHKESRNQTNPTPDDVARAIEHVRNSPTIKEVVVTGGDPFMSRVNMETTIDGLMQIDHVQSLRLATRSIAYYPDMFLEEDARLLNYLKRKSLELQAVGKRMEIATHFIHPDEISPQSLRIITELTKNGISVYVQTPFLHDCNDRGPELVRLFSLLRGAGAELHYIYIPCSPIHGNSVYWTSIARGIAAGSYLRAHLSDRVVPRICTATPIGKMDWNSSGWAVEPVADNENFIWIRSPYTPEYFKNFAPLANALENIRVNEEGTIDIQYMARLGDESLFLGSRPRQKKKSPPAAPNTAEAWRLLKECEGLSPTVVATGSDAISRVHATRVELALDSDERDFTSIESDDRITDVVVVSKSDIIYSLNRVRAIAERLKKIPHVNSMRLRSLIFNENPRSFTPEARDMLAGLNSLTIVNPLRIEIETCFLTAGEITKEHAVITRELRNKGITVYSNTPLLFGINDDQDSIHNLAYNYRQAGIEFHHLYVSGLTVQKKWNEKQPVSLYDVVDIATKVRREGSGREIPRYIIKTALGEVDYGLATVFAQEKDELHATLLPYDISYFRAISSDFSWPEGIREGEKGHPVVRLEGLLKSTDFPLC